MGQKLQTEQRPGSLKEELNTLLPYLEEMRKRKLDRKNQFFNIIEQIQEVSTEIYGSETDDSTEIVVDENDLSLRRLEEMQTQLQSLQKEKVHLILINYMPFLLNLGLSRHAYCLLLKGGVRHSKLVIS